MAGALVGGAFLSAFLQVLFDRIASPEVVDFFRGRKLNYGLLQKLEIALLSVNAVLDDAEEKQVTKPAVKDWLDRLKDAVYDAEDILDVVATEALQRKLDAECQTTTRKVRNSIAAFLDPFVKEIEPKVKEVLGRLEYLAKQKDLIGLREAMVENSPDRLPTTSLVDESEICGRDEDREAIINLLLSDDASDNGMDVISLVGMGGIGKTTLAQLVFNDSRVKKHFNLHAWICVSNEFDIFQVTKTILETITSSTCDTEDLNRVQVSLKENLVGKKFLLVLDDVWNKSYADWEVLSNPLKSTAHGSRILITTRDDNVASVMRSNATHCLKGLSEADCWLLFAKHAFHYLNSGAHPQLEILGRKIVEKCRGLPLAVKTTGALLRSKMNVDEWDKILKSELWDLPIEETNILPALRLSYKYLPSYLKRCFVYCSIFPKGYAFGKDQLVLLWMAEGFLQQYDNKTMEEVGDEYFLALASRSLFQQSSGSKSHFVMHDLINDLARFIAGQHILRLEVDRSHGSVKKTRHLSYSKTTFETFKKFEALYEAKSLRTFLPLELSLECNYFLTKKVPRDLLPRLRCLRVLSLCHYKNLTELPRSIGKSKQLRYLDISFTAIRRLPDSICKLCNLQTLKLAGCEYLTVLPRDMHKLINLRHLDLTRTGIKEIPLQLSKLKCLQSLTKFIIGEHDASCTELGKLKNLRGTLCISELQNVVFPMHASLKDNKYLEELVLEWNVFHTNISESQITVLDSLQPHNNLKSLIIDRYSGKSFPDWVGYHSFSNIVSLHLKNCRFCCTLPPLGQLPSLQDLSIVGFASVVTVGPEFYGSDSSSLKPFRALKVLRFEQMLKWEKWFAFGAENEGEVFSHLGELYMGRCPKLTGGLPVHLPSLAKLEMIGCDEVLLKELPNTMQKLRVEGFEALESLPGGLLESNSGLQELSISGCCCLKALPSSGLPLTLTMLVVMDCWEFELPLCLDYSSLKSLVLVNSCDSLVSFPLDLFPKLSALEICGGNNLESLTASEHDLVILQISIAHCPKFVSFPEGGLRASNLTQLWVDHCGSLRSLPDMMHVLLPSLQYLYMNKCPEVESFPEGGLPSNLNSIIIDNCDKLFASRMRWGLQRLPSVHYLFIGGESGEVESFPEAELLPTSLTDLRVAGFPNLRSLDKKGLQHLTSLELLEIHMCPKIKSMPEEGLPASLSLLRIHKCPLLKQQLQRKKGKEWRKIAHVPSIWIDDEFD